MNYHFLLKKFKELYNNSMVATPARTSVAETGKHPEVDNRENLKSKTNLILIGDDYKVCNFKNRHCK